MIKVLFSTLYSDCRTRSSWWLQHQEGATRVYWSDREHQFQCGIGVALQIRGTTDEVIQKVSEWQSSSLPTLPSWVAYLSTLQPRKLDSRNNFQQAAFTLPFLTVQQDPSGSFLWVHLAQNIEGAATTQELFDLLGRLKISLKPATI